MFSESVTIRPVEEFEIEYLHELSQSTFLHAFSNQNKVSDMELYFTEAYSLAHIRSEYENPNSQFFFAEYNSEIIGYLKVNQKEAQTDRQLKDALEIQRIYIVSKFQGMKVGALFLEFAIELAREKNLSQIWLGVWEKNLRAIAFYTRYGFKAFSKHEFMLGRDLQFDIMMKFELAEV